MTELLAGLVPSEAFQQTHLTFGLMSGGFLVSGWQVSFYYVIMVHLSILG
jgi:hypothetical protein